MTKIQCQNEILRAIEHAKENGYNVIVATDPEGNNWNSLNPLEMIYSDSNKETIALGVWEHIDEEQAFIN